MLCHTNNKSRLATEIDNKLPTTLAFLKPRKALNPKSKFNILTVV